MMSPCQPTPEHRIWREWFKCWAIVLLGVGAGCLAGSRIAKGSGASGR